MTIYGSCSVFYADCNFDLQMASSTILMLQECHDWCWNHMMIINITQSCINLICWSCELSSEFEFHPCSKCRQIQSKLSSRYKLQKWRKKKGWIYFAMKRGIKESELNFPHYLHEKPVYLLGPFGRYVQSPSAKTLVSCSLTGLKISYHLCFV